MRIVTRPDFDGVVCAVLLYDAEEITEPIFWVEPNDVQQGRVEIRSGDIVANLPYHENCTLWFDHHYTNRIRKPFHGAFREAPSAARIIYDYYRSRLQSDYQRLVDAADKIDSADLTREEVTHPEKFDDVLLSMTITNLEESEEPYWNHLVAVLSKKTISEAMEDAEIRTRCEAVIEENRIYKDLLLKHTQEYDAVAVTDFRPLEKVPGGNRFLVYSLFPACVVHMRIRYDARDRSRIVVNVGHSIFNPGCRVNVGLLLARFGGGGHPGAGSCRFPAERADEYLPQIRAALIRNEPLE